MAQRNIWAGGCRDCVSIDVSPTVRTDGTKKGVNSSSIRPAVEAERAALAISAVDVIVIAARGARFASATPAAAHLSHISTVCIAATTTTSVASPSSAILRRNKRAAKEGKRNKEITHLNEGEERAKGDGERGGGKRACSAKKGYIEYCLRARVH